VQLSPWKKERGKKTSGSSIMEEEKVWSRERNRGVCGFLWRKKEKEEEGGAG